MPIHDYKCTKCQHEFEVFYSSQSAVEREEPTETCPRCQSKEKERTPPTKTSFQLKGKGWFRDGY